MIAIQDYRMPAEWTAQEAVWLSFPVQDPRHWAGKKQQVIAEKFAEIAAAISHFQPVRINVEKAEQARVMQLCQEAKADIKNVQLYDHAHNDVWCRDHGPIFVKHRHTQELAITDWDFNAWGGKFPPWNLDNEIPARIGESLHIPVVKGGMILEGGAIEVNGSGALLTTEAVLLNSNRNPHLSREGVETKIKNHLGVNDVFWLEKGIEGDDTDGHIDDLARFTDEKTIIACVEKDRSSPNQKILQANLTRLKNFSYRGSSFDVAEMHMPAACEVPGWRLPVLPASYVNFLIINHAVLVPTFRQAKNDQRALAILAEHFPNRKIIGIDCLELVEEGGTLHCISQQQPAAV